MVGHRALVAVERAADRYDLYYSHEGAYEWRLARTVATDRLRALVDDEPTDSVGVDCSRDDPVDVDSVPVATDCSFETVLDQHVDFQQYEALYRVPTSGPVEPFLVCWFGLPGVDAAGPDEGALVSVEPSAPLADGEYLRGWFAGVSSATLRLVDEGGLDAAVAPAILRSHLRSWASDRELHWTL